MKLLKFCNIKNIYETRTIASLGIPLLGYHVISESDFARLNDIKQCVRELRSYYPASKAILVTKERDVEKIVSIVNELEFDGVQLHYSDSNIQASALKGRFGSGFIVIQVVSQDERVFKPAESDYVIIDQSYLGGTGKQVPLEKVREIVNNYTDSKILLAGGISASNLYQYLELPIVGFDVQSAIKSDNSTETENTDYSKMYSLARLLGYHLSSESGLVGFAIQDINQGNRQLLGQAFKSRIDFFHIDISDGFIGSNTDLEATRKLIADIKKLNTHLRIQVHFFISSQDKFDSILSETILNNYQLVDTFVHINRDNYSNFSSDFIAMNDIYFGIDVKDVIDESFPWEQFVKDQLLVCLQSKEHDDRVETLNRGLKLIRYSINHQPIITLDRSVDNKVVLELEESALANVVCGSYLRENISERYQLLKKYLNDKAK